MISSLNLYDSWLKFAQNPPKIRHVFSHPAHLQSGLHAEPIVLRIGSQGLLLPQFVPHKRPGGQAKQTVGGSSISHKSSEPLKHSLVLPFEILPIMRVIEILRYYVRMRYCTSYYLCKSLLFLLRSPPSITFCPL